MTLKN